MIVRVPDPNEGMLILLGTMIGIQAILTGTGSAKEIEALKSERDRALHLLDEQKLLLAQQDELIKGFKELLEEREKWSHLQ